MLCSHMDHKKIEAHHPTFPSGRLSRWLILLAKFDLKYVARKTIKGSTVSNFYVENPIEGENGKEGFLDKDILDIKLKAWKMYFDGTVN